MAMARWPRVLRSSETERKVSRVIVLMFVEEGQVRGAEGERGRAGCAVVRKSVWCFFGALLLQLLLWRSGTGSTWTWSNKEEEPK